jgi:hypothetical protein
MAEEGVRCTFLYRPPTPSIASEFLRKLLRFSSNLLHPPLAQSRAKGNALAGISAHRLPTQPTPPMRRPIGCPQQTGSLHRRTGGLAKGNAGHFPQSTSAYYLKLLETAAPSLALKLKALPVGTAGEIERKSPNSAAIERWLGRSRNGICRAGRAAAALSVVPPHPSGQADTQYEIWWLVQA